MIVQFVAAHYGKLMTNIRRYWQLNQTVFLTHVTHGRFPCLVDNAAIWHRAIARYQRKHDFDVHAWVILPDHVHVLLTCRDITPSQLFRKIKLSFSQTLRMSGRFSHQRVWQNRFWDRIVRNESEFEVRFHYIHFNPVKHGLVRIPFEWPHSSFQQYLQLGYYDADWGEKKPMSFEDDFGE